MNVLKVDVNEPIEAKRAALGDVDGETVEMYLGPTGFTVMFGGDSAKRYAVDLWEIAKGIAAAYLEKKYKGAKRTEKSPHKKPKGLRRK